MHKFHYLVHYLDKIWWHLMWQAVLLYLAQSGQYAVSFFVEVKIVVYIVIVT